MLAAARRHALRGATALERPDGQAVGYGALLAAASRLRAELGPLKGQRVAFLAKPDQCDGYVAALWGAWAAGAAAVPLHHKHPARELEYVLRDSEPAVVLGPERLREVMPPGATLLALPDAMHTPPDETPIDDPANDADPALLVYTSGTTGPPKGVVHTHRGLLRQTRALVEAWGWTPEDRILHFLPLHHMHGILCKLLSPLLVGAEAAFAGSADAAGLWRRLAAADERPSTVFMAVPTVYMLMLEALPALDERTREAALAGVRRLRLMVSGSMSLPTSTMREWERLTGHRLLERYGMTELGMALSNPLRGERTPGAVGFPLPGVEARVGGDGELLVRGDAVFAEYWRRPEATAEAFDADGWFRTGDTAAVDEAGRFRILGRTSVDILSVGGHKVSALDVERALLEHPAIAEAAAVGLPDERFEQRVGVVVRSSLAPEEVLAFGREQLADYRAPREALVVESLPKNAMGKVSKVELAALFG